MKKAKHPDQEASDSNKMETQSIPCTKERNTYSELLATCTYGIEYVIEEVFNEGAIKDTQKNTVDWFGISDLTKE